jgi:hypothetical protein
LKRFKEKRWDFYSEELIVLQFSIIAGIRSPSVFDKTKSLMQNKLESPSISKLINIPVPEGIVAPEKLKASTVEELLETDSPASIVAPPEALIILPSFTPN